ncbi:MAG: DeoR/GlpR family DNA-binding transcription regulator [Bacteroidaceae bacterium]|nr:DeoR/GlpR family DNA-binding transcription regulator [Bacteroidaceae bacterium]
MIPRRADILKILGTCNEVLVTDLAKQLNTSEVTIRKDLTLLQKQNLLIRTRGGAIRRPIENLNEDTSIGTKRLFNYREKERIGKLAASLIKDGETIMLDSGTTTMEIAKNLDKFYHLTILTNSINIAEELMKYQRFNVIILGGHVRFNSHSTVGSLALTTLKHFSNYKLFLGVDSFSLETGISTPSRDEALLNQEMIHSASETIAVFDSSKFNTQSFVHIAAPEQIDTIVTDKGLLVDTLSSLRKKGIHVLLA